MNEEFVNEAITNDRYLKAARLTKQFEEEIDHELRNFLEDTIDKRPDIFVDNPTLSSRQSNVDTEPLARSRRQASINRVNRSGENLIFYICIEWTQPEMHGEQTEGTLCTVQYKIKNLPRGDYDLVKEQTRSDQEWANVRFGNDVWNRDRGIFYIPVTGATDIQEGLQTLRQHFFSFYNEYGSAAEEV